MIVDDRMLGLSVDMIERQRQLNLTDYVTQHSVRSFGQITSCNLANTEIS